MLHYAFVNTFRNPEGVHAPIAFYSHQGEVPAGARWLALSGQLGMEVDGSVPEDPIAQLDLAFTNIERNLHAAGMTMRDAVKFTIYLVGEFPVPERRAVIVKHLGEYRPCVTLLIIAGLADARYKVEIEAWAAAV